MNAYEVVVVGGGAAGLSGALMLARSRRSVLVVDAGSPRNAPASGVHGLLGREGMPPLELLDRGRAEVRGYGGSIVSGSVVGARRDGDGFVVSLEDGSSVRALRLLMTSGLVDELPEVPGLRERWGRDVVHCPYCHGWEVRDQPIGVLATGPASVHHALLFRQLTDDLIFFRHEQPAPPSDFASRGITVVDGPVAAVEVTDDAISGIRLVSGRVVPRRVVAVASRMVARAGFLDGLGLKVVPHASGMGEHIPVDASGRTEVPGVWAAGNVTDLSAQVGSAAAAGAFAGAQINFDLIAPLH
ncbi:thioredoxin reductase [Actinoplanes tereljensis]|uniref:Oxidoreductase n=1 Tax=Paractinoplanes tereljensis TaxID=571912 RepID=A0A919NVB1_9ACTN|nr:NAD(P)/FAD-dependent oxidoreductase [Actinoplanes tereljensis]GIF25388.1 oxidoreductase [Actinoplanes tereljensis]